MIFSKQRKKTVQVTVPSKVVIEIAVECLGFTYAEAKASAIPVAEVKGYRFSSGTGSLIIGDDQSLLFAPARVPLSEHIAAYREGRRTNLSMFSNK